jgi:class 3 adenylate cyclase
MNFVASMNKNKNTRLELNRLLQERNEHPERSEAIDRQIEATFKQTHALFVLDMSGFSRTSIRYGIIHFLAMVHRMKEIVTPAIAEYGGSIVKQEADNVFAVFPEVQAAVDCARDLLKRAVAVNTMLPDSQDIYLSIGIGYGDVLMLEEEDMYGSEFNLTAKLGEDLAERNEVLITESAFGQLQEPAAEQWEQLDFSISGLELLAYKAIITPGY